jgi:hypothetical protein
MQRSDGDALHRPGLRNTLGSQKWALALKSLSGAEI